MCLPLYCHYLYFFQFAIHNNHTKSDVILYILNQINKKKTKHCIVPLLCFISTSLCTSQPCLHPDLLQLHMLISINKFQYDTMCNGLNRSIVLICFIVLYFQVGIPYPHLLDIQVGLKKKYNDANMKRGLKSGSEWYETQAYR